jgi:hypothetical protein
MITGPVFRTAVTVLALTVLASAVLAGCSRPEPRTHDHERVATPTAGPSTAGAATDVAAPAVVTCSPYPVAPDLGEGPVPRVPYTSVRLHGVFDIEDYTDRLCALSENRLDKRPTEAVWLLRLADGKLKKVVSRPVNRGFNILGLKASDRWLAWEEVSPGDDLVFACTWKVYAARIDRPTLTLSQRRLVDSGATESPSGSAAPGQATAIPFDDAGRPLYKSRPLFVLVDDRLLWITDLGTQAHATGELRSVDLRSGERRLMYTAPQGSFLGTIGAATGSVWVTEPAHDGYRVRVAVFNTLTGERVGTFDLDNRTAQLTHFPSLHAGFVAWAVMPTPENAGQSALYLRDPDGVVHRIPGDANNQHFAGRFFFYGADAQKGVPGAIRDLSEVCGVDLRSLTSFRLAGSNVDTEGSWSVGMNVNYTRHVFLAAKSLLGIYPGARSRVTILRVYRLD